MQEYIENDDIHGNNFALEVLDNFIDENLKSVLMPVLQHSNFYTKFKQLQYYFSLELVDHNEALSGILTSEYNQVSLWTKASILHSMIKDPSVNINDEIIACLFHSDTMILESAACLIYNKDPERFYELAERLEPSTRIFLDHTVSQLSQHNYYLIKEKVLFLKKNRYFGGLRVNILVELAKYMVDEEIPANTEQTITGEPAKLPVYFVYRGQVDVYEDNERLLERSENEIIDFLLLEQEGCKFYDLKAFTDCILFSIPRELLNLQLFDFPELEIIVQNYMNDFFNEKNSKKSAINEKRMAS